MYKVTLHQYTKQNPRVYHDLDNVNNPALYPRTVWSNHFSLSGVIWRVNPKPYGIFMLAWFSEWDGAMPQIPLKLEGAASTYPSFD